MATRSPMKRYVFPVCIGPVRGRLVDPGTMSILMRMKLLCVLIDQDHCFEGHQRIRTNTGDC